MYTYVYGFRSMPNKHPSCLHGQSHSAHSFPWSCLQSLSQLLLWPACMRIIGTASVCADTISNIHQLSASPIYNRVTVAEVATRHSLHSSETIETASVYAYTVRIILISCRFLLSKLYYSCTVATRHSLHTSETIETVSICAYTVRVTLINCLFSLSTIVLQLLRLRHAMACMP